MKVQVFLKLLVSTKKRLKIKRTNTPPEYMSNMIIERNCKFKLTKIHAKHTYRKIKDKTDSEEKLVMQMKKNKERKIVKKQIVGNKFRMLTAMFIVYLALVTKNMSICSFAQIFIDKTKKNKKDKR